MGEDSADVRGEVGLNGGMDDPNGTRNGDANGVDYGTQYGYPHAIILTIMSFLAVFISGVMVFIVILFIIVPINKAIDNAPARLFSINQTILVFYWCCHHV